MVGRKEALRLLVLGGLALAWLATPSSAFAGDSNVTIQNNGLADQNVTFAGGTYTPTGNDVVIDSTLLNGRLLTGPVTINTGGPGTQAGTITVQAAVSDGVATNDLTIAAASTVSQSAPITVDGNVTVSTGAAQINLGDPGNAFGAAVSLSNSGANDVSITDSSALLLGASTIGRNLTATANGPVTQSGALNVSGGTTSVNAGGTSNNVILATSSNNFSVFKASNVGAVTVTDSNGYGFDTSSIGGNLTASITGSGDLTQINPINVAGNTTINTGATNDATLGAGNDFTGPVALTAVHNATLNDANAIQLGSGTVSGNLSVAGGGAITQTGALSVTGTSSFDSGANNTTLGGANTFAGAVSLHTTGTGDASVTDSAGLTLGSVAVARNLSVTASGNVTQSNTVVVDGLTTIAPGAANDVTLHTVAGNNLNQLAVPSAHDVSVLDASGGIVVAGIAASNNATVDSAGAGAGITESGPLTAPGTTLVGATSSGDVALSNANNDFGTLSASNVHDLSATDKNALNLGGASATGDVSFAAGGPITQSGNPVSAGGSGTFNAGAANDITLDSANSFGDVLNLTAKNADVLGGGPGVTVGLMQIANNLKLTASGGPISQGSQPLTVPGTAAISSPATMTLTNPGNDFGTLTLSGAGASVTDANGVTLGTSMLSGGLDLVAGGDVLQSGAGFLFGGASSFTTGSANDLTLANSVNHFGSIAIPAAHDALIRATGSISFGAISTAEDLTIQDLSGDLTDDNPISVGRNATLETSGASDVTLPNGANHFGGNVTIDGRNAVVNTRSALSLGGTSLAGTLQATGAAITQAAPMAVGGDAALTSGPGATTLVDANNDFGGEVHVHVGSGQNATIRDKNDLTLGDSVVTGNLLVSAANVLTVPAKAKVISQGTATLVTDSQAPAKPNIGGGGIVMGAHAQVSGGGPTAIYTAKRGQNQIDPTARLNGIGFVPGPIFIDSDEEVWGTYFPAGAPTSPFTIFYKDTGKAIAPQTKLKKPRKRWVARGPKTKVKFKFTSSIAGSSFLCKLDHKPVRKCSSPFKGKVKRGKHVFKVRATKGGVADPTPAKVRFKVVRQRRS